VVSGVRPGTGQLTGLVDAGGPEVTEGCWRRRRPLSWAGVHTTVMGLPPSTGVSVTV